MCDGNNQEKKDPVSTIAEYLASVAVDAARISPADAAAARAFAKALRDPEKVAQLIGKVA